MGKITEKSEHNLELREGKCCGFADLVCEKCGHRGMDIVEFSVDPELVKCPNCGHLARVGRHTPAWTKV